MHNMADPAIGKNIEPLNLPPKSSYVHLGLHMYESTWKICFF